MISLQSHGVAADDALLRLPFDQYGRYRMVREAVDAVRAALDRERLAILDVGGYYQEADGTPRLPSQQFLGDQELTVLDLPACDLPGYVQGDGTAMTFVDGSFDLVISCDTLEHIPPDLRDQFVRELTRVARYGVLLICPMDDYRTALAEQVLFAYIQAELLAKHDQLREHREYGLPQPPLVRRAFEQAGCVWRDYPSGDLHAWLPMMLAKHYLMRFADSPPELQYGLDELYNRGYALAERREPSYRRLIVAAKQNDNDWLAAVDRALEPTVTRDEQIRPEIWRGLATQLFGLLQVGLDDRREERRAQIMHGHITTFQKIVADQHNLIVQLGERESQLQQQVADLEGRARWLEEQASEARRQLAAVEQGRVMRLLRRFGR
ncbi:MAG TPA: methyltransferase domain-containing protein [Roseiflexaceae bacterium]|nr:methyltransferase domain-containing protein [Roseiflexaceae bacterium]